MKFNCLVKFLSLLIVSCGTQADTSCPTEVPDAGTCPPGPPVYYPDPDECSNYWLCVGGCASNGEVNYKFFLNLNIAKLQLYCLYVCSAKKTIYLIRSMVTVTTLRRLIVVLDPVQS